MITKSVLKSLFTKVFTSLVNTDELMFMMVNQNGISVAGSRTLTDYGSLAASLDAASWPAGGDLVNVVSGTKGIKAVSETYRYECKEQDTWARDIVLSGTRSMYATGSSTAVDDSAFTNDYLIATYPNAVPEQKINGTSGKQYVKWSDTQWVYVTMTNVS